MLIPDNCKTATVSQHPVRCNFEPQLPGTCRTTMAQRLCRHVSAGRETRARQRHPSALQRRGLSPLCATASSFPLRELNEAVAEKLEELNSRPFKQMAGLPPERLSGRRKALHCCRCQPAPLNLPSGRLPKSPMIILLQMARTNIRCLTT